MYYVENNNTAILSRETYEAVQRLQKTRTYPYKTKRTSVFSGKIRCPECGGTFRAQTINGIKIWLCSAASTHSTDCVNKRIRDSEIRNSFYIMTLKLKDHYKDLFGSMIRNIEQLQENGGENHERITEIDRDIANLAAQNLIITRLHTNGILNSAEFAGQSAEIGQKIGALRAERKKKLAEDHKDEQIDQLHILYNIFDEYQCSPEFDEELFEQVVENITVTDNTMLTFHMIGDIKLTETILEKGRCGIA